jgi:CheY-like chemotaxis protein
MDISLITSGNLSLNKKDFSPAATLKNLYESFKPLSLSVNLNLVLDIYESDIDLILVNDNEVIRKIIHHLISNAIKFTETGYVKFGYRTRSGEIEFFVEDSGIGIAKESLSVIFERFVKEERNPYKISEGSGLGLSIVKGMVAILGGDIRVDSELGKGTSVYFTLPITEKSVISVANPPDVVSSESEGDLKILVAEDDETNYFYLKAILSREGGMTILHALNGQEAVDLYKSNPDISIILMDIKMPVMDGIEATRQIKLMNKNVPVIAITAFAMSGDEERVLQAGCDAYLSKPISKKNLLDKIELFTK